MSGLVVHLWSVGLDRADKLGSAVGGVLAAVALLAPHLLPAFPRTSVEATPPAAEDRGPGSPVAVDLRGSQGVQVNTGGTNRQHNTFGSR
ncbi:hypothetical protein [Micromonospora sp. NBRC 101691]|uniref:hypothetical protein n=1 Tax=Micromonospora sp. NBRC 101691 TaxID=3032198 RepID=UPI0025559D36|nr:hypothetical protein [Micromonospora sp. NBRC 101691]